MEGRWANFNFSRDKIFLSEIVNTISTITVMNSVGFGLPMGLEFSHLQASTIESFLNRQVSF